MRLGLEVTKDLKAARMAPRNKAPVFVLGCPRSGTTLLYHMLLSSGNFAVYRTESNAFNILGAGFGNLGVLRNKQKLLKVWLGSKLFTRSGLDADQISAKILAAECRNAGDFLRIVMEEIVRSQKVERWADTTPTHLLYLFEIKTTIPNALVIHVIRDGRDVALSLERLNWLRRLPWDRSSTLMVTGLYWEWIVRRGREQGGRLGQDYTEVRFEELVTEPRATLTRLGRFIDQDLDYDRILGAGVGSVSRPNTSFESDLQENGFNPVGRWRERFPADQLAMFEGLVGGFLEDLGYPLVTADKALDRPRLRRMRSAYRFYFNSKLWIKKNVPLTRLFVSTDLSHL